MKAVVLAGDHNWGPCPLSSALPKGLWPLVGRPLVQHLIQRLFDQGLHHVAVCTNGNSAVFAEAVSECAFSNGVVDFFEDPLPRGAAGCVADVARRWGKDRFVVLQSNVLFTQSLAELLAAHRRGRADMTVALRAREGNGHLKPAGVYVFEPTVFDFIKPRGYQDLKEQLIPALAKAGRRVLPFVLRGGYLTWQGAASYLDAMGAAISNPDRFGLSLAPLHEMAPSIFYGAGVEIARSARLFGPLAILDGASVGPGAVLVGPSVIGPGSYIGPGAVVNQSVLWAQAEVGRDATVSNSVIGTGAFVRPAAELHWAAVPPGQVRLYSRRSRPTPTASAQSEAKSKQTRHEPRRPAPALVQPTGESQAIFGGAAVQ